MNKRLKFRTPYYVGEKFAGFQYWEFEHGRVKSIGEYWESWVSKRDKLTAKPDEQCPDLKDKNGNLIYEGDIVKTKTGSIYEIKWVEAGFFAYDDGFINAIDFLECPEIIGNIHEQPEQKDVK